MRQASFSFIKDYRKEFGGSLLEGKRKTKRPLSTKHPLHLILKSSYSGVFAPGNISLEKLIRSQAKKFGLKIYDLALNWSHIHFILKIESRKDYNKFIRSLTAILAKRIRKLKPHLEVIFELRPFTRIISWGRDFKRVLEYAILNQMEAFGMIIRTKRKKSRKKPVKNRRTS